MRMASKSPKPKGGRQRICVFCEQDDVCQETYGKLLSKAGVTAHYFCMLFSSGLSQNGKSEKQGILGFLQSDILKEVKRGSRLRCSYCRKIGATIGCVIRNCKKTFHLGCGRNNNTLHQFFGTFSTFCAAHRVQQDVPSDDDPNIVCSICMNTVTASPSNNTIRAPCCRKYWYHRECVQRYATSAGLYFFKCPLCNNKDDFQDEMLTMGIYIPDQDASWEKEPHAFQELLERYSHCDAPVCKCVEGRKYDKEGSKWEIILCDFCGSHGAHEACNHLEKLGKHDICHDCKEVDERTREEEYFIHSPPHKRKSLELLQLELASSPDTSKGASPYPGPSDSMKKVGLPSPEARLSPRMSRNARNKSAVKKGKRLASPENIASPLKVKKQRLNKKSATASSTMAKNRKNENLFSPNTSSQSSDDSSDDGLPFCVLKNKLSKMELESAWDVRRRKRMEYKKKHAKKKEKEKNSINESDSEIDVKKKLVDRRKRILPVIDSETDTASEGTDGKRNKGKENQVKKKKYDTNTKSVNIKSEAGTDTGVAISDSKKIKSHENYKLNGQLPQSIKNSERRTKERKEKVRQPKIPFDLQTSASTSGIAEQMKQGKSKKRALDNDKSQTTLKSWIKQKNGIEKDIVIEPEAEKVFKTELKVEKDIKTESAPGNTGKDKKKPVVIEWKGKQLIIRSPKVVLNRSRSRKALKIRPKNLEIDMNDVKGCCDWNRDIDLLSNLETDVRVTRKMIDIDQLDTKKEKAVKSFGSPARCHQKQEKNENTTPIKKSKNVENLTNRTFTRELNNNEIQTENTEKVVMPVEGRSADKMDIEIKRNGETVSTRLSNKLPNNKEDSPAKNLRVRKTREDISNAVSTDSVVGPVAHVFEEFAVKNSPVKNTVSSKSVMHSSPKCSDSPAKNLRQRRKKIDQKTNLLEIVNSVIDNSYSPEKENQLTPTIENCLKFTVVRDRKCSEDPLLPSEKNSFLVRVKDSSEWGSVILRNDVNQNVQPTTELNNKPTDNIERLKMYKPQMSHSTSADDSPAKNLRKRNNPTDKITDTNVNVEVDRDRELGTWTAVSDSDRSFLLNQLERLKKYRPKFKYLYQSDGKDLKSENSVKEVNQPSDPVTEVEIETAKTNKEVEIETAKTNKEVEIETAKTSKEMPTDQDVSKQRNIIWFLEGAKQLEDNITGSRPERLDGGSEHTWPNPLRIVGEADIKEVKTHSPGRKNFSLDDILEEKLAEINDKFPTTVSELDSPDELCNTAVSLSPSFFTKFRRSCSRSESLESFSSKASSSKFSIEKGGVTVKSTTPSPEQGNPLLALPQSGRNLLDAVRNKAVAKLRSSPRPKKAVTLPAQNHISDKISMAEYYGASLEIEQKQKKSSVNTITVEDDNGDITEMPSLLKAGILM